LVGAELRSLVGEAVIQEDGKKRRLQESDIPRSIFSTITINKTVRFPSHADAKNESGLACLMVFGKFAGGDLCLPRLRVAFRLRPGDILVADNNQEQHGNTSGPIGERISVVAYLRQLK